MLSVVVEFRAKKVERGRERTSKSAFGTRRAVVAILNNGRFAFFRTIRRSVNVWTS
jgi:hypothetical protein